ncbi:MAG: hypothetical protein WBB86_04105 [Candidatus Omnitrophota bacterium]
MKPNRIVIILLFILLACPLSQAAQNTGKTVEITSGVDKEKIEIGDWIKLEVLARNVSTKEVIFPEESENLGEFTVVGSNPLKSNRPGSQVQGQAYVLSIYTTGTHVIPPIEIKYRQRGEEEWHSKKSPQIPIEVRSVLTGDDKDIKDLKRLVGLGGGGLWIFLFLAVVLAAAVFSWLVWRRKRTRLLLEEKAKPPDVIAHEELDKLKAMDLPGKGRVKEYYVQLSDIVRRYLEGRFSYRAPEMTTEEFLNVIKRSEELTDEHKELLREFLSHCDMVKFAKYGPTSLEMIDSYKSAERLVDQTKTAEEEGDEA